MKTETLVVLADGETFTLAPGCFIVEVAESRDNALDEATNEVLEAGVKALAQQPDSVHLGAEDEHGLVFVRREIQT